MKKIAILMICLSFLSCSKGESQTSKKKIDLDLSKMNYNMVSGVLFEIMTSDDYIGKCIKIKGQFISNYDESTKSRHYAVVIYDPTACCQTGLMFIPRKEMSYPKDFPAEMSDYSVTGILREKEIDGMSYLYLDCEGID